MERTERRGNKQEFEMEIQIIWYCYKGRSRSRAVGAFAVDMIGGNNNKHFKEGTSNQKTLEQL